MVPRSRAGTFSPNPTLQTSHNHSPQRSQAGGSPSTQSPTGIGSLTKIVVAQVYLLLSTIKDEKDDKCEQLRKVRNLMPSTHNTLGSLSYVRPFVT